MENWKKYIYISQKYENENIHAGYLFHLCFIFPWMLLKTHFTPSNLLFFKTPFPAIYTKQQCNYPLGLNIYILLYSQIIKSSSYKQTKSFIPKVNIHF